MQNTLVIVQSMRAGLFGAGRRRRKTATSIGDHGEQLKLDSMNNIA
jgi:hypothetical protein